MTTHTRTPRLLTTAETADLLAVETRTLEFWRKSGTGPPTLRLGYRTVRYSLDDLIEWMRECKEANSWPSL